MKALLLAAGRGERLRPLTDSCPKPMIEIGGKPILQHNVELLVEAGIHDIVINLHHSPEAIVKVFGDGQRLNARIQYVREERLLGTSGALRNAAGLLGSGDCLVVYSDNLSTIDLRKLIALHKERKADLTMALYHRLDTGASGIVAVNGDGRVTRFLEKPSKEESFSNWVNAGYYVVAPSVVQMIPETTPSDFARDVFPKMLNKKARLFGYRMTEKLWWIDSMEDYRRTQREFSPLLPG
ncbi:MAG: nucleotidyltransferase family protein [Candidatus Baltobacteraceae bacterium]